VTLHPPIRTIGALLAAATLFAQTESPQKPASTANDVAFPVAHAKPKPRTPRPDQPLFNLDTIVLDPAHGASDHGAKITDDALEKDVNLAFANRLKSLLTSRGFNVIQTRTADPADLQPDQRVEIANRSRAVACILIHASNGGHGVHIFTSALTASSDISSDPSDPRPIIPWDTAQAAAIPNSLRLANDLATALNNIRIPLVLSRASVSSIDSMTCPAIALELAPLAAPDGKADDETPASDEAYQQRVADAVVSALVFWRGHAASISAAAQAAQCPTAPAPPPPVKKPKPKLVTPPVEVPDEPGPATQPPHQPAPVVRKPPPDVPATVPPPPPGAAR
jgi:N-acetylmuramoyl-L-alanine amidase